MGHLQYCAADRFSRWVPWRMTKEAPELPTVVFVIDDDPSLRNALTNLFRSVGLGAETFGSAPEFLQSKLPDVPSCLVLDIRLPGPSGLDFQSTLVQENIHIPIIFMTGHGDIPMTVRALKAGAVDFLTKPFRDQDMLDAVSKAIEHDRKRRKDHKAMLDLRSLFDSLTPREQEVLALVTGGLLNKQIAAEIGLAEITEDTPRAPYEENGREVVGRLGKNGGNPWCPSHEAVVPTNVSMTFLTLPRPPHC